MFEPTALNVIAAYYGEGASAVFRNRDWPTGAASWFLQRREATSESSSRWFTTSVYGTEDAALATAVRWGGEFPTLVRADLESGEVVPAPEQPVSIYRVVTLLDLFEEGAEGIATAIYDVATSDHEWMISTELGSEAKIQLSMAGG